MKVITSSQMREIEASAAGELGIPTLLLMENAAMEAEKCCMSYLKDCKRPKAVVIAGQGNNGGDGFALARRLYNRGVDTEVIFVGNMLAISGDALTNLNIVKNLGIPLLQIPLDNNEQKAPQILKNCDLVADAMFGIGLSRPLEGIYSNIVEMINDCGKYVVSLDVPSGVNGDTGHVMGCAVRADKTITFGWPKQGLYLMPGAEYSGEIITASIQLPPGLINKIESKVEILTDEDIPGLLPNRPLRSHKGSYGRVYVMAGNWEMPGAALLSCTAAYRCGAGLVKACVAESVADLIHKGLPEAVTSILPDKNGFLCKRSADAIKDDLQNSTVILIGPGLGRDENTFEFLMELLSWVDKPAVIDADGLNLISENVNILKSLKAPCVITPHPGEMSRLTGLAVSEVLEYPVEVAREFACEFQTVTVLKDARTIIASPTGEICINTTGSPALSKAGTGDVLAGTISSFIAQGLDAFTAAKLGSHMVGKAGTLAEETKSSYGVGALDLTMNLPLVLKKYSNKNPLCRI